MRDRRHFLAAAAGLSLFSVLAGAALSQTAPLYPVVSRERMLREVRVARVLRAAEQRMAESLQAEINRTKDALGDEEAELARLRSELAPEDLRARIEDFDKRMRLARQVTQSRAGALQKEFQEARAAIVAAIPQVLEQLRIEVGAAMILNADQALAVDPKLDLTARAVALFDRVGPEPGVPELDLTLPMDSLIGEGAAQGE